MSALSELESLVEFWEMVDYVGLFLVFAGVVVESLVEFTGFIRSSFWEPKIGKTSALILVIGLTLELISSSQISTLNRKVMAILAEEVADAERRAKHAEGAVEEERAARVKLEAEVESTHQRSKAP